MNVTILYLLSVEGQKASLIAGGDGKAEQSLSVESGAPEFARAIGVAAISNYGKATIDVRYVQNGGLPRFDATPTASEILDAIDAARAAKIAADQEDVVRRCDEARRVLSERRTRNHYGYLEGPGTYQTVHPDWGYGAPSSVTKSPEALAWTAELEAANAESKIKATKDRDEAAAKEAAAKEAAQERETERREKLGLKDGDIDLDFEDGALTEVPVWEKHRRGKNWMAVIQVNPKSPGGLDRAFAEKAKGDSYYLLPSLCPGDAIEFGADYYSGSGRKSAERRYYYVVRVDAETETECGRLILHQCDTGKAATTAGAKIRKAAVAV